jgi:copper resistance protein C
MQAGYAGRIRKAGNHYDRHLSRATLAHTLRKHSMKPWLRLSSIVLAAGWLLIPIAHAHTTLTGSTPKSGATLDRSPATIEIQFRDPAKLTAVVVVAEDKSERKLTFAASDKPNSYSIREPNLATGRNEVKWTALSHDGHVIRGTLMFTVQPTVNQN